MPTDQTIEYLAERGFSRGDARINRPALADACIAKMLERIVGTDQPTEFQEKGLIASELRDLVLGVPEDEEVEVELDGIIAGLTAPMGLVQKRLSDGVMLCSARVNRVLSSNGDEDEPTMVSRVARFLSDNPDVTEKFFILPAHEGLVKKGEGLKDRWDLAEKRQPALAARRRNLIDKTQQRLQLALEVGA
jgi:hypothetical protein